MTTVPVARGLILCESSWADDFAGRVTLTDCFTDLAVRSFPSPPRTFWVAAFLSDGMGTLPAGVVVTHLETWQEVYRRRHGVSFRNRLEVVPFRQQVDGLAFPGPGSYEVALLVAGEPVAAATFTVRQEMADDE